MKPTDLARPTPIVLAALVALLGALLALAFSNGPDAHARGSGQDAASAASLAHPQKPVTDRELRLRNDMRKLWEDHIVWTRLAIISLTTDSPDTEATVGRLLENQTAIGDAVKPFYGDAAGNELTSQLRRHILIAAELVAAARAGDAAALADAQARWRENADVIAAVLNSVNPRFWKLGVMQGEMATHLTLTTEEAVARLQGEWDADVAAYDRIHDHILHMADLLSSGIVKQFPSRFR